MANSDIVSSMKEKVISAITHDDTLFAAIDAPECENGGDLINTHIFRYNKNPNTITNAITFLTIMVHVNQREFTKKFVNPTLEIWIYSHNDHMDIRNIPKIKDNRNDYISKLLDDMFNGSDSYGGIGKLALTSNTEGTYNEKFLYRRMFFETIDVNDSMCNRWDS